MGRFVIRYVWEKGYVGRVMICFIIFFIIFFKSFSKCNTHIAYF